MRTDRRTEGHDEANSCFCNFANAPKNRSLCLSPSKNLEISERIFVKFDIEDLYCNLSTYFRCSYNRMKYLKFYTKACTCFSWFNLPNTYLLEHKVFRKNAIELWYQNCVTVSAGCTAVHRHSDRIV